MSDLQPGPHPGEDVMIVHPEEVRLFMMLKMSNDEVVTHEWFRLIPTDSEAITVSVRDETDSEYLGEEPEGPMLRLRRTGRKFLTIHVNDVLLLEDTDGKIGEVRIEQAEKAQDVTAMHHINPNGRISCDAPRKPNLTATDDWRGVTCRKCKEEEPHDDGKPGDGGAG